MMRVGCSRPSREERSGPLEPSAPSMARLPGPASVETRPPPASYSSSPSSSLSSSSPSLLPEYWPAARGATRQVQCSQGARGSKAQGSAKGQGGKAEKRLGGMGAPAHQRRRTPRPVQWNKAMAMWAAPRATSTQGTLRDTASLLGTFTAASEPSVAWPCSPVIRHHTVNIKQRGIWPATRPRARAPGPQPLNPKHRTGPRPNGAPMRDTHSVAHLWPRRRRRRGWQRARPAASAAGAARGG